MAQIFSKRTYSNDKERNFSISKKDLCEKRSEGDHSVAKSTPSETPA